jgi:hypothetical protein
VGVNVSDCVYVCTRHACRQVTRGVMYTREEAEGKRLRNPQDTITEGIGAALSRHRPAAACLVDCECRRLAGTDIGCAASDVGALVSRSASSCARAVGNGWPSAAAAALSSSRPALPGLPVPASATGINRLTANFNMALIDGAFRGDSELTQTQTYIVSGWRSWPLGDLEAGRPGIPHLTPVARPGSSKRRALGISFTFFLSFFLSFTDVAQPCVAIADTASHTSVTHAMPGVAVGAWLQARTARWLRWRPTWCATRVSGWAHRRP